MISHAQTSHIGSCLSAADILAVLYGDVLRLDPARPEWADRDRLIVSKGHAAAIVYAALAETGFFPRSRLDEYAANGSELHAHVTSHGVPGVELSTGSLGHGLPVAAGMALIAKRSGAGWRTFVLMSDGELDEGSNWEAFLFAAHHCLDNLVAIIDYNKIQSLDLVERTLRLEPLADKLTAFGWTPVEVDGHDVRVLHAALATIPPKAHRPTCVIAHTVKGKGVSYMEGQVAWHYRPPSVEELGQALADVDAAP